ncbi:MAG TPA: pyridoxal-phosphate dependent enzyme, partial [Candidatus Limnocylindrales bacterium]|nr:pyridoxal-phosphate dependent enzyme [Candidatus Limnocylindrales bacterium]
GLEVHTVLSGPADGRSPNVELIERFGGTVHQAVTADRAEREALVDRVAGELRAAGRRVKVIPVGGSDAAGAWGQVLAGLEVLDQASALEFVPDAIVLPTATGGTHAGLITGAALAAEHPTAAPGRSRRIVGVVVAHSAAEVRPVIERLVGELAELAQRDRPPDAIELDDTELGPGYGIVTDASTEAAGLLARTEGILVDPIYGAKALAGLIDLVRSGSIDGQRVIFWHGGGLPSPFEP